MENFPKYFDPQTLAKLRGLELRARHIVEGYVAGAHQSPYHGFSIEFAEHREYAPGDDLRYVDWKVFGKTDKFYLKQYEEETNLIGYLLLDASQSMRYRSEVAALSKLEYAQCLAAALGYLVLHQQDSVGLAVFDCDVRSWVRPSSNPSHLKQLVHAMEQVPAERKSDLGPVFHELAERLKRRGVVIVLSDLLDNVASLLAGLKHLRYRRHEVVVLHVLDPAELDFPFQGTTLFEGLEQLPRVITDPRALRRAYLAEVAEFLKEIQRGCRAQNIDYLLVRTDQPLDRAISTYLVSRTARAR